MTKDKQIAWEYKAPEKIECHAAQPPPNGNVLVVEVGTSRIVEVDRQGKIAKEIKLTTAPEAVVDLAAPAQSASGWWARR